jgi:hypothetical protein
MSYIMGIMHRLSMPTAFRQSSIAGPPEEPGNLDIAR